MRLSYHGWAAVLLVLSFVLVAGGIALAIAPVSVHNGGGTVIACGFPWEAARSVPAECVAAFGERSSGGEWLVLLGVALFGGILLVGMLVAGVRDALASRKAERSTQPSAD